MTGQSKFTTNNIRQIDSKTFSRLSINMKIQFTQQTMNLITRSKKMYFNFYIFLAKPTLVKTFYVIFYKIIQNWTTYA